ncbi:uncharacterized protein MELLADRAFT_124526 [Melampsora larici-populina 98AG31]|uniref:Secreted protein n=1 Tax=Melampsora larici-populina (strain 98AG31 / pathotype 3-4-7) TaxID=747676 RepID=F4RDK2_MELLP|nr:uncharacterized protein MELLADRAFT_124526 [Melampsora larici-populina 98AG31]EGG09596.1 secreted protein [Melampsora larici-populina 98AG31]
MNLSIVAAIFMASVSFNQVFGTRETGILSADQALEALGNPLARTVDTEEDWKFCPACKGVAGASHTCASSDSSGSS